MENFNYKNEVDYVVEEKLKGKEYDVIKKSKIMQNLSPNITKDIIRKADNVVLDRLISGDYKGVNHNFKINEITVGYLLMFLGLGVTILTYFKIINLGDYYLIAHGPVIAGITLVMNGKRKHFNIQKDKRRNRRFGR